MATGAHLLKVTKSFCTQKAIKNLEQYDCRAVSFIYSYCEQRFSSYKKFQAYAMYVSPFLDKDKLKIWRHRPEKFLAFSRNRPLDTQVNTLYNCMVKSLNDSITMTPKHWVLPLAFNHDLY